MATWLEEAADGILLRVWVQPRAKKDAVAGVQQQWLKLRLSAPPVEGAANKAAQTFLAGLLGVAKSRITLQRGDKSRQKVFAITGLSQREIEAALQPYLDN